MTQNKKPRLRFAPSPTGYLHLGNLRTALFNELFCRQQGGTLVLRLDDTDEARSEEVYVQGILEDLKFLGIEYQEGPFRQSEHQKLYQEKIEILKAKQLVYPCFCSKEAIETARAKARGEGKAYRYAGTCIPLKHHEAQEKIAQGEPYVLRFKVTQEQICFHDLIWGEKRFHGSELGDFVITRGDGSPLYLFTSAVDDAELGITHIIRGEDGLSNTPRQILLWQALGYEVPVLAHLPLILGSDRKLLSKRHGASSLKELRRQGYVREAILNALVLLGWAPPEGKEILSFEEMLSLFNLEKVARHAAVMDFEKLNFLNAHYLRHLPEEKYLDQAKAFVPEKFQTEALEEKLLAIRNNLSRLDEIPQWFERMDVLPDFSQKLWPEDLITQESINLINLAVSKLEELESHGEAGYKKYFKLLQKLTGLKGKKIFMPLRLSLTGEQHGPELYKVFQLFNPQALKERFQHASDYLQQRVG